MKVGMKCMSKKKSILIRIFVMLICYLFTSSILINNIKASEESSYISILISGNNAEIDINLGAAWANKPITVQILYPDKDITDITDSSSQVLESVFVFADQSVTDNNGYADVSCELGNVMGNYTVRVSAQGKKFEPYSFFFFPEATVTKYIDKLFIDSDDEDSSDDWQQIKDAFENIEDSNGDEIYDGYRILGIRELENYEMFNDSPLFTEDVRRKVFANIAARAREKRFESLADVGKAFNEAVAVEAIAEQDDISLLQSLVESQTPIIGLSVSSAYTKLYQNETLFDTTNKSELYEKLSEESISLVKAEEVVNIFNIQAILVALNNVDGSGYIDAVITEVDDLLEIEGCKIEEYNLLSQTQKNSICMDLVDEYADISQFVAAFNRYVEEVRDESDGNTQGRSPTPTSSNRHSTVHSYDAVTIPPTPMLKVNDGFVDLHNVAWAKEAIEYLAEQGIVSGESNSHFNPERSVTREEFVKMIVLAVNLYKTDAIAEYSDVLSNKWYYSYIASATEAGIVIGYDGQFGIGQPVSRQDVAVMLYRVMQNKELLMQEETTEITFTDEQLISDYAKEAVAEMQKAGILNGFDDGRFGPDEPTTRAQAAMTIYRISISLTANK